MISILSVFGLSIFGALRPVVLERIVDENLTASNYDFFLEYIIIMVSLLVLEVASNYSFIFNAGLLGQSVVKDIRVKGAIAVIEVNNISNKKLLWLRNEYIRKGVWVRPIRNVIYFMPSFVISLNQLKKIVSVTKSIFRDWDNFYE